MVRQLLQQHLLIMIKLHHLKVEDGTVPEQQETVLALVLNKVVHFLIMLAILGLIQIIVLI